GAGVPQDVEQLDPDEPEGDAGDEQLDDVPERPAVQPLLDLVLPAGAGHLDTGDHDGHDAGGVDVLGEDVDRERQHQGDRVAAGGVGDPVAQPAGDIRRSQADEHGQGGSEGELPDDVQPEGSARLGGGHGGGEHDDGDRVVEQAL